MRFVNMSYYSTIYNESLLLYNSGIDQVEINNILSPLFPNDKDKQVFSKELNSIKSAELQFSKSAQILNHYLSQYYNVGHDFPIWFSLGTQEPSLRVMIISQDPLRKNQGQGTITFSTPFGMHVVKGAPATRGKLVNSIIKPLFDKCGNSVLFYMTDYCKLYYTNGPVYDKKIDNFKKRISCSKSIGIPDYEAILNKEIEIVKPNIIITLGDWINGVRLLGQEISFDPHQSPNNQSQMLGIKLFTLYHPNHRGTSGLDYNGHLQNML